MRVGMTGEEKKRFRIEKAKKCTEFCGVYFDMAGKFR